MGWSVLVYESGGLYIPFSIADLKLYDMMKETLSGEENIEHYGMRFIAGKRNIDDKKVEVEVQRISGLVEKMNRGEDVDLEKELE